MATTLSFELPHDVMVRILLCLPVKSLIRFKCVQKSWLALIQSQSFIHSHYHHATRNDDSRFKLVLHYLHEVEINVATLHPSDVFGNLANIYFPSRYRYVKYLYILPVCANGIICFHTRIIDEDNIILWNPATRDYRVVNFDNINMDNVPESTSPDFYAMQVSLGFGYDAKTNDYKVIRIVRLLAHEDDTNLSYLVKVYSLKTNSWKRVHAEIHGYASCHSSRCSVFMNGIYHWGYFGFDYSDQEYNFILCFDMSEDTFFEIKYPDIYLYETKTNKEFAILNGSFALISYSLVDVSVGTSFEIWVMNEYRSSDSWEKKYIVGPILGLQLRDSFLGLWNDVKLLLETISGGILQYDLESGDSNTINLNALRESIMILSYSESLVSIKGGDQYGN